MLKQRAMTTSGRRVPGSGGPSLLSLAPAETFLHSQLRDPRASGFRLPQISGRLYCTQKSLWKLNWFLRDFGYDPDLLGRDEVDEKALLGLTGILRTTRKTFAGRIFVNLEGFAPSSEWEFISKDAREGVLAGGSDDLQLHAD